jgi:putative nucleotidyltransferase with HDIG domain
MKPPQANGLRAQERNRRKFLRHGAGGLAVPFTSFRALCALLFARYVGPVAVLAILVAACFTLPIHRSPYRSDLAISLPGPSAQPADYHVRLPMPLAASHKISFTIPAIRRNSGPSALIFWLVINSGLLILASWYWLVCFRRAENERKQRRFILRFICTIPAFAGLMAASVISGSNLGGQVVAASLGTAGVIASALLMATVIGLRASTIAVAGMAAVMGLMDIFPAWATVAAVAGAIAGQYMARSVRDRSAMVRCAELVSVAAALSAFVASLLSGRDLASAGSVAFQAALTGCFGSAIWFTLLTTMERPFELTTPLGLLELLDPTRPMLARFAREAPGTFAHSLMVGHLAASAAEPIGADPLLCRVAAQYHDLGKLCRAQFFKENQREGVNVHDRLAPSLSAIVVTSHVKDGERMAKELGLPPVIRDIITQHHGTSLMQYFYYRASEGTQRRADDSLQYQFRYPGPKPQTKEAGIMMMADAIEAASRTLTRPTRESVRELVDQIIDDRISDHQLDECPLTLKDITIIRVTLAEVVCAVLHQRVEYPGAFCDEEPAGSEQDGRAEFDFYEDFDPAVLFTLSDDVFGTEALRATDFADEIRTSASRDDALHSEDFGVEPASD